MTQDRTVRAILKADVSSLVNGMKQAAKATDDFAKKSSKSATDNKAQWEKTGKGMMVAGGVIAAGVVLAIKTFADFDAAMSRAQAGTMATGTSLGQLRAAAIKSGADTQFSATEAADAITAMGKAGVSTKDILGGGLTGALSLAAAGQLDVAQASEIAATAMNQFGLEGKDIPHIADLLAAGAGKAMGSVQDLAGALKYVGPVAKGLGVSIEETTGTLAMFAQQGILGEQAGTSMRGMLLTLTSPSAIVAKKMEALGINVYDANGKFIGLKGAAGELQRTLGPLDDATRNAALGQIFGNEQVTAARVLYEGGAGAVDTWTKSVNDAGFAARQAAMLTDNFKGDIERLGGSLSSVLIQSGSGANDMLRSMTKDLQGVVDGYGGLPVPLQQGVLGFGAVTAAVLLTGGALVTVVPKLVATKVALYGTEAAAARTALALRTVGIAAAAMALTAGADIGIKKFNELAQADVPLNTLAKSLDELGRTGKIGKEGLDQFTTGVGPLRRGADDTADALHTFAQGAGEAFGSGTIDAINRFVQAGAPLDKFAEKAKGIDAALAQLVSSGNADSAAVSFKKFSDIIIAQGGSVTDVATMFPTYTAALDAATVAATTAAAPTAAMIAGEETLAKTADEAKKAHDDLTASIQGFGSAMMTARGDARSYEAAIDAAQAALKANGRTLDIHTEKGRANAAALDGIRDAALKAAESNLVLAEENGTLGAATKTVTGDIGAARDAFIKQAVAMGMPKAAAAKLATQAGLTRDRVKEITTKLAELGIQNAQPKITLNGVPAALTAADRLIARLKLLTDKNLNVHTSYTGTAPGQGHTAAGGGYIRGPGTTTSDSIPASLSDKEYVVKAKAVDYYGVDTMHAINSMRFSAGGYVGPRSSGSAPASGGNTTTFNAYGLDADKAVQKAMRQWEFASVPR